MTSFDYFSATPNFSGFNEALFGAVNGNWSGFNYTTFAALYTPEYIPLLQTLCLDQRAYLPESNVLAD